MSSNVDDAFDVDRIDELAASLLAGQDLNDAVVGKTDTLSQAQAETCVAMLHTSQAFQLAMALSRRLQAREWLLRVYRTLERESGSQCRVDVIDSSLSQERFLRRYYFKNRPFVWPGVAVNWRATRFWGRDYLKDLCGSLRVEVMSGRQSAPVELRNVSDKLRREVVFSDFLDLIYGGIRSNDVYLVSRNDFFSRPGADALLRDIGCPSIARMDSSGASLRLWLGPGGTTTALHYDNVNQLFVQIVGEKRVRMISPLYSESMKQNIAWYAAVDPSDASNKSDVPYFSVSLSAGDGLFIPVGWWHAVEADSVSASVTFRDFGVSNCFE